MILRDIRITSNKNEESLVKFMLKVGIDGGGRFFKFCLNMVKRKTPLQRQRRMEEMKKLLIIGIAQDILETYYNAKTMMDQLKLESIDFIVATDYKL